MQRRGRSRHISPVALARLASEERTRSEHPLQRQIQVAYALDDIRRAKSLLLRLKGTLVPDLSDPRIDQVRDDDLNMLFAPDGPLALSDADRRAIHATHRKHKQWCHESHRAHRLRACERLWEDEKNRLHADKCRALQKREHDDQDRARPTAMTVQIRATPSRSEAPPSTKRGQDPFQYTFMPPCKPSTSALPSKPPKKARSPGRRDRCVSFKEVLGAMNGQLFPLDTYERAEDARRVAGLPIPGSTPHRRKASVRAELLDSLLQVVQWQEGERRRAKGKEVVRDQQPLRLQVTAPTPVPSAPSSFSVISLSSSASPSRSSSWLTFGSWRSTATDITTPDSPATASPVTSLPCLPTLVESQRELHPRSAFVRVSVEDSPLCPPLTSHCRPTPPRDNAPCAVHSGSAADIFPSLDIRGTLVKRVTRSVATIVEVAKGLQSAYLTATMFTAGPPYVDTPPQPCPPLRREGYRALARDVRKFTDCTTSISQMSEPVHFIPLVSHPSGAAALPRPPVPKNAVIFPSPLRPRTPPAALAYRMRPVANPAVLRLRALQNLMYARGKEWEGRAREGGLGCGKERMLGIAFEGRGRSGLGCEVRFVVA